MAQTFIVLVNSSANPITLRAAISTRQLRLRKLDLYTEDGAGDITIEDGDGTSIGGKHAMGQPDSAQSHNGELHLEWDRRGGPLAPRNSAIQLDNEDTATITGIAVIEAI